MSLTNKQVALASASILFAGHGDDKKFLDDFVLTTAAEMTLWLASSSTARLAVNLMVTAANGTQPVRISNSNGGRMSTAMTVDDANVMITVQPEDDHGDATADMLTWTADDNGSLLTATLSADTHTWTGVPVAEGTVTITVSDPSAPNLAPFTAEIVIGPGATSQLVGSVVVTPPATA